MITMNIFTFSKEGHVERALIDYAVKNLKINEYALHPGYGSSTLKNWLLVRKKMGSADINYFTVDRAGYLLNFLNVKNAIFWCWDVTPLLLDYFPAKSRMLFKFDIKGIRNAKRVIASSESTKRDLIKHARYPENKISVILPGVDHGIFKKYGKGEMNNARKLIEKQYGISEDEKIVLYVGGEQPRKNIPTLLQAISKTKIKLKLLVVGPRDWKDAHSQLLNLTDSLGIRDKVIFSGQVSHKYLPDFYNAADVFTFPSYYEGFGFPLLEAMACGCPVVTTNCSSIPEVVGDAAIKISDPFDYNLLAEKIEEVLTNERLKSEMIAKGLKQAQKFSWKKYVEEVYRVCEGICSKQISNRTQLTG